MRKLVVLSRASVALIVADGSHFFSSSSPAIGQRHVLSDFIELEMLDHILGIGSYSPPSTVYLALSQADPTDDASGLSEPSNGAYGRKAITFSTASTRTITQSGSVVFNTSTASWGTVTHWALMDTLTGGNMMACGQFSSATYVDTGTTLSVDAEQISVTVLQGGFFTLYANSILDWLFRGQSLTQPSGIYLALSTSLPDDDGNVTEPTEGGYTRIQHDSWNTAALGSCTNSGAIFSVMATASWGTVVALAIYDSPTGGTEMFYSSITPTFFEADSFLGILNSNYKVVSN